jgi:hypothetical protein
VLLATFGDWDQAHELRDAKRIALGLPLHADPSKFFVHIYR